jgi:hypothetical protein
VHNGIVLAEPGSDRAQTSCALSMSTMTSTNMVGNRCDTNSQHFLYSLTRALNRAVSIVCHARGGERRGRGNRLGRKQILRFPSHVPHSSRVVYSMAHVPEPI